MQYPNNNSNNQSASTNNTNRFSTGSLDIGNNNTALSLAQQPLLLDLLQELRKIKEEADWAKQKLAETIMLISKKDKEIQKMDPVKSSAKNNNDKQNLHYEKEVKKKNDRYRYFIAINLIYYSL